MAVYYQPPTDWADQSLINLSCKPAHWAGHTFKEAWVTDASSNPSLVWAPYLCGTTNPAPGPSLPAAFAECVGVGVIVGNTNSNAYPNTSYPYPSCDLTAHPSGTVIPAGTAMFNYGNTNKLYWTGDGNAFSIDWIYNASSSSTSLERQFTLPAGAKVYCVSTVPNEFGEILGPLYYEVAAATYGHIIASGSGNLTFSFVDVQSDYYPVDENGNWIEIGADWPTFGPHDGPQPYTNVTDQTYEYTYSYLAGFLVIDGDGAATVETEGAYDGIVHDNSIELTSDPKLYAPLISWHTSTGHLEEGSDGSYHFVSDNN